MFNLISNIPPVNLSTYEHGKFGNTIPLYEPHNPHEEQQRSVYPLQANKVQTKGKGDQKRNMCQVRSATHTLAADSDRHTTSGFLHENPTIHN